jgi:hypothetical protein
MRGLCPLRRHAMFFGDEASLVGLLGAVMLGLEIAYRTRL